MSEGKRLHRVLPQDGEAPALQGLTELSEHTSDPALDRASGAPRLAREALLRAETLDQAEAYAAAGRAGPNTKAPSSEPALIGAA